MIEGECHGDTIMYEWGSCDLWLIFVFLNWWETKLKTSNVKKLNWIAIAIKKIESLN